MEFLYIFIRLIYFFVHFHRPSSGEKGAGQQNERGSATEGESCGMEAVRQHNHQGTVVCLHFIVCVVWSCGGGVYYMLGKRR